MPASPPVPSVGGGAVGCVGGGTIVVRRVVSEVGTVVGIVMLVVGTVMNVVNVIVNEVDGEVVDDEPIVEALVAELEVDDVLVDVEPTWVRVPPEAVTRLFRSTRVTSGSSTPLVPGMVLDSTGAVDDGKTSVRDPSPGLTT